MAIGILLGGDKIPHHVTHNLKSLFYILIWVCTMYKGPGNQERASQPNEELPLSIWHKSQTTLGHIGDAKSGHCSSLVAFNS